MCKNSTQSLPCPATTLSPADLASCHSVAAGRRSSPGLRFFSVGTPDGQIVFQCFPQGLVNVTIKYHPNWPADISSPTDIWRRCVSQIPKKRHLPSPVPPFLASKLPKLKPSLGKTCFFRFPHVQTNATKKNVTELTLMTLPLCVFECFSGRPVIAGIALKHKNSPGGDAAANPSAESPWWWRRDSPPHSNSQICHALSVATILWTGLLWGFPVIRILSDRTCRKYNPHPGYTICLLAPCFQDVSLRHKISAQRITERPKTLPFPKKSLSSTIRGISTPVFVTQKVA